MRPEPRNVHVPVARGVMIGRDTCQNPVQSCERRSVIYCAKTRAWLCRACYESVNQLQWDLERG